MPTKTQFIETMAKQLPPSAASLRLLDIGGVAGQELLHLRPDLAIEVASLNWRDWQYQADSFDAVLGYDLLLKPELLAAILNLMRAGGRFILVNPLGTVNESYVQMLENAAYCRLLVEAAFEGQGVLIRGEKAHLQNDTLARVQAVAQADADLLDLAAYRGRFLHLLVQQTPNKPVWAMRPDEPIRWQAISLEQAGEKYLLAFSSLPKAVSFMQLAVLQNRIQDVNKMPKFSKEKAQTWTLPVLLNPQINPNESLHFSSIEIDPKTAESPDE